MTRTMVLAAPSQQLSQLVSGYERRMIYHPAQPVWDDVDLRRDEDKGRLAVARAEEPGPEGNLSK
jgi:hypothetical protein